MQLIDKIKNKEYLSECFQQWPDGRRFETDHVELKRVKEGRRALLQIQGSFISPSGRVEHTVLMGKVRFKGLDHRTYALHAALFHRGFGSQPSDHVCVPEPITTFPALHLCVYRRVEGRPLIELLQTADAPQYMRRVVEALTRLNRANVDVSRTHSIEDELTVLDERLKRMLIDYTQWTDRLLYLKFRCHALARRLSQFKNCPIHRDFYHDQVIVGGERLYLLDLDTCALGDPALDIGNFLAHLIEFRVRNGSVLADYADLEREMIIQFNALWQADRTQCVRIYTFLSLVRLLTISTQMADRREYAQGILQKCEEEVQSL